MGRGLLLPLVLSFRTSSQTDDAPHNPAGWPHIFPWSLPQKSTLLFRLRSVIATWTVTRSADRGNWKRERFFFPILSFCLQKKEWEKKESAFKGRFALRVRRPWAESTGAYFVTPPARWKPAGAGRRGRRPLQQDGTEPRKKRGVPISTPLRK